MFTMIILAYYSFALSLLAVVGYLTGRSTIRQMELASASWQFCNSSERDTSSQVFDGNLSEPKSDSIKRTEINSVGSAQPRWLDLFDRAICVAAALFLVTICLWDTIDGFSLFEYTKQDTIEQINSSQDNEFIPYNWRNELSSKPIRNISDDLIRLGDKYDREGNYAASIQAFREALGVLEHVEKMSPIYTSTKFTLQDNIAARWNRITKDTVLVSANSQLPLIHTFYLDRGVVVRVDLASHGSFPPTGEVKYSKENGPGDLFFVGYERVEGSEVKGDSKESSNQVYDVSLFPHELGSGSIKLQFPLSNGSSIDISLNFNILPTKIVLPDVRPPKIKKWKW